MQFRICRARAAQQLLSSTHDFKSHCITRAYLTGNEQLLDIDQKYPFNAKFDS